MWFSEYEETLQYTARFAVKLSFQILRELLSIFISRDQVKVKL